MTLGLDSLLTSAFFTGQRCLKVTAQNSVNADNPNYCRIDVQPQTQGVGPQDMHVCVSAMRRSSDPILLNNLSDAQTDLAQFSQTMQTYALLESCLGPVGDNADNLSSRIAAFFDVLSAPALAQDQDQTQCRGVTE